MLETFLTGFEFCCSRRALPEMIDYNGHVNVAYYAAMFDDAAQSIMSRLDLGGDYRVRTGRGLCLSESHIVFRHEIFDGEMLGIYVRLIGSTSDSLHTFFVMVNRAHDLIAATQEALYCHCDLVLKQTVPMEPGIIARFTDLKAQHDRWPLPVELGRSVALRSRSL